MSIGGVSGGSGGSFDSFIQQLLSLERQPAVRLESSRKTISQKLGVLSDISTRLTALRSAISGLKETGSQSSLRLFTVSSSDASLIGGTASGDAAAGTYALRVTGLARAHALATSGFVGASASGFGSGTSSFAVTVNGTPTTVSLALDGSETNSQALAKIVGAINQSGAGVTATLVTSDVATGTQKIVLTSKNSGTTNMVSSIADTTGTLAAQLGIAGASAVGGYHASTTQQAANAEFTVNGLALSSASNTAAGVIAGVTLDLKGLSASADVTIKVVPDTTKGKEKVEEFITKYNEAIDFVRGKLSTADTFDKRGILAGSSSFSLLLNDLRSIVDRQVTGLASGALSRLADLGISSDRQGKLSLTDANKLAGALTDKQAQVEAIFNATGGVATRLESKLSDFLSTTGVLAQERNVLNSQDKNLKARIQRIDSTLEKREVYLRRQYSQLLEMAANLTAQQNTLSALNR